MAILSKIRERSMFLILVIGLALFAFVLDPSTIGDFFDSTKINTIGEVDGEAISRAEFSKALEAYKAQAGSNVSEMEAAKTVWDNLISSKIYKNQLLEAGITVGEEDILNALYETPSINSDPKFQSAGMFDAAKLKEYLATIKGDEAQQNTWASWRNYMAQIKESIEKRTYDNLITAGLGASLKEGEMAYVNDNTSVTAQYVYVPYTSVADSLVTVSTKEVAKYVKAHAADFKVEEARDIKFVRFNLVPTAADEKAMQAAVSALLEDTTNHAGETVVGFKNATDMPLFLSENNSDENYDDRFKYKNDLPASIATAVMAGEKGASFGPYSDNGFLKISKIVAVSKMADSVKASHILIPFVGSRAADASITQTEEEAKKTADSILKVVRRNSAKFAKMAKQFSSDKSNADKGGDLDWFTYNRMVPEFRDFSFTNKKGATGVVKTDFGFHIIKINGRKNVQKVVKIASYARKIEASEATENAVFQAAETFALAMANGDDFYKTAKAGNLIALPAVGLKVLDENVPGLGKQRQIITWAFGKDVAVGSFKRFDLEKGHVVAVVANTTKKGLQSASKAMAKVRPILQRTKKAAIIAKTMDAATLADNATANATQVKSVAGLNLKSPTISGVGNEPKIVGAMVYAAVDNVVNQVVGDKGVFSFKVTKKEVPTALPNYESYRQRLEAQRRAQSYKMFEAIKAAAEIEDNRALFYGIQ